MGHSLPRGSASIVLLTASPARFALGKPLSSARWGAWMGGTSTHINVRFHSVRAKRGFVLCTHLNTDSLCESVLPSSKLDACERGFPSAIALGRGATPPARQPDAGASYSRWDANLSAAPPRPRFVITRVITNSETSPRRLRLWTRPKLRVMAAQSGMTPARLPTA